MLKYPFKLINPPKLFINLIYRESYNEKILKKIKYEPIITDTICWVALDEYSFKKTHKYTIDICIIDTINNKNVVYSRDLIDKDSIQQR